MVLGYLSPNNEREAQRGRAKKNLAEINKSDDSFDLGNKKPPTFAPQSLKSLINLHVA